MAGLYDHDIVLWSERQGALLRRRAAGQLVNEADIDWPNVAEEIESLGRTERSTLRSHIGTLIEHLMKLQASPATDPRNGWKDTVRKARRGLHQTLNDTPSLRREVGGMIADETHAARKDVAASLADHGETPRVDVGALAFTEDQVLGDWMP